MMPLKQAELIPHTWQYDGGYITLDANGATTSWNYYVTDHLGSTRKVVTSTNAVKETINFVLKGGSLLYALNGLETRPTGKTLSVIKDPRVFMRYVELAKEQLKPSVYDKLMSSLQG